MRLPLGHRATIDPRKITEYLLSAEHPVGMHKLRYFERVGFSGANPESLLDALRALAVGGLVAESHGSPYGTRCVVDGDVESPTGVRVALRTVWIVPVPGDVPQFVTAYPRPMDWEGRS